MPALRRRRHDGTATRSPAAAQPVPGLGRHDHGTADRHSEPRPDRGDERLGGAGRGHGRYSLPVRPVPRPDRVQVRHASLAPGLAAWSLHLVRQPAAVRWPRHHAVRPADQWRPRRRSGLGGSCHGAARLPAGRGRGAHGPDRRSGPGKRPGPRTRPAPGRGPAVRHAAGRHPDLGRGDGTDPDRLQSGQADRRGPGGRRPGHRPEHDRPMETGGPGPRPHGQRPAQAGVQGGLGRVLGGWTCQPPAGRRGPGGRSLQHARRASGALRWRDPGPVGRPDDLACAWPSSPTTRSR